MGTLQAFTGGSWRRAVCACLCLILLSVGASSAYAKDPAKTKRVAVLYFDYEGADAELAFLRKGFGGIAPTRQRRR